MLPPVEIRIFGPKSFLRHIEALPAHLMHCTVGWLVCGCGARAVSRKTPIYFIYALSIDSNKTKIFTNMFTIEFHARPKKEM